MLNYADPPEAPQGRLDGKGLLKVPNEVDKWRPHAAQPTTVKPTLERIDGARHARRPSAKAKKLGKRRATDLGWADDYNLPVEWSEEEPMPDEDAENDCGWRAGPIARELLPFKRSRRSAPRSTSPSAGRRRSSTRRSRCASAHRPACASCARR